MAMFVHLTLEKNLKAIQRNGIGRMRSRRDIPRGIFAMPVTRNFYVSHQWLRELKGKKAGGTIAAVYFRIADAEMVSVGHYNQAHQLITAAEALDTMSRSGSAEGFEVIIHRRIEASEIHRVRILRQVIGWRFYPAAKGRKPCGCEFCQKGEYNGRKIRERAEREWRQS
jgi:hypothetical protein